MDLDLAALTDAELDALAADVTTERARRWAVGTAAERAAEVEAEQALRLDEVAASFHGATGGAGTVEEPVPWVEPTGAHDVWPVGSVVIDESGTAWESLIPANATPPDRSNGRWWRELAEEPGTPAGWTSGTYYRVGDVVTRDGGTYTCTHEHLAAAGWEPENPTMHAVWRKET